jgi:ligand-binding sensor domain-containing protein/anti-sigma regulatory factor (Ser/Thr protein kinase)
VRQIIEDAQGNLWIAGVMDEKAFAARLNKETNQWVTHLLFNDTEGIYSMIPASDTEFWLGSRLSGLFKWNFETYEMTRFVHDAKDETSLAGNYVQDLVLDRQGTLWIATRNSGLCKMNSDGTFKRLSASDAKQTTLSRNDILDLCLDDDYLWIAVENGGLNRMHIKSEEFENFYYDKDDPNSIVNNSIWSLYRDHQKRIWIGSFAKGLCSFDPNEKQFYNLKLDLENDLVNAILKDNKGRLWIGSEDGLLLLNGEKRMHFKNAPGDRSSLSSDAVQCLFEDSKNRIWIGTWNGGINLYDEVSKSFIRYTADPKNKYSLKDPNVFGFGESSRTNQLLVCTFAGLHVLVDEKNGIFENLVDNPQEGDQLLLTLLESHNQDLYVGSFSGLSRHNIETKKIERIRINRDSTKVDDRVNFLFEDSKQQLWVGTFGGGLHVMTQSGSFKTYTKKDGLPVDVINGIVEDDSGNLWISTSRGLTRFDRKDNSFTTFDALDGLNANSTRDRSIFMDTDGFIYLGSRGVNVFHPDSIQTNTYKPPVYITDLKVLNKAVSWRDSTGILTKSILNTEEVTLKYDQNILTIHFVAINFTASEKNNYAYKLENFDGDWSFVDQLRFATYTNLDPGTYIFKVMASNNDGVWNEQMAELIIHVLPPWWKTWWFRTLALFAVVLSLVGLYRLRTRNIRQVNQKLEQTVARRTSELQHANQALLKRDEEISEQNHKLSQQSEELAAQNEELIQSQEEIASQRDLLASQNIMLTETQRIIEEQNVSLEEQVASRTKDLVEYNQQLEQFAFISAHNLRSPVARILGLGNLLSSYDTDVKEKEEIYRHLVSAAYELDSVVRDLMTILDIRKNNQLYLSEISLQEVINTLKNVMASEIDQAKAVIRYEFNTIDTIRTVKPYFESILYNLISNAIKFRHPQRAPEIFVQSEIHAKEFCISVSDNGLGIDTALFRDKLFTLYSRFHTHMEGKGMGLYMVRTQVTALGGRVEVESEVNKGSRFTVYLKHQAG